MKIFVKIPDNGILEDGTKRNIGRELKFFKGIYVSIKIEPVGKKRSDLQNAYYWGVVIKDITNAINNEGNNYSNSQVHELLKSELGFHDLIGISTFQKEVVRSTTKYTTKEFEDYLERCRAWAVDVLNIDIQLPKKF